MRCFLFKPITKALNKRNELIEEQFKNAEQTNAQANAKLADYESRIANVEDEAQQIIANAKDNAKVEYGKIIDKAEADASVLKANAKKQIEAESASARKAANEEIAALAIEAAEKVVRKSIDVKTDSEIFDEFLSEGSVD
jgi:F-type H+-transporting ATPase subunit b